MRAPMLLAAAASCLLAPAARADGAFPDSFNLLAPEGTSRLYLSATFGFITSADGGASWYWTCEEAIGPNVMQYQVGAGPAPLLYAVDADQRLSISRDEGASWAAVADPGLAQGFVYDVFPDPVDPLRVVALFTPLSDGTSPPASKVVESRDGARTFAELYAAPAGARLESVEIARSDPRVVWAVHAVADAEGWASTVVRLEAGQAPRPTSLEPVIGRNLARIASVDPVDAGALYLRVTSKTPGRDALAIVRGAGAEVTMPLSLEGAMSTFVRRANGDLIVGSVTAGAFVSRDGGLSFAPWPGAPAFRALAERAGVVYAAADNFKDGFAVGQSTDGTNWAKLLVWSEMCGVFPSAAIDDACSMPWNVVADSFLVTPGPACPRQPPSPAPAPAAGCGCSAFPAALGLVGLLALSRRRPRPHRAPAER
jgi:hypothetical protein